MLKKVLRPRQEEVVDKAIGVLCYNTEKTRRSLIIAPTGSGKTVMFCTLAKRAVLKNLAKKILILVHRTEIFYQNVRTFNEIEGDVSYSIFCQEEKDLSGQVVFGMVLTFNNEFKKNPNIMHDYDVVIVDEAHHTCAGSYTKMLRNMRNDAVLFGFTATPKRGDGARLSGQYTNVCAQIFMHQLINSGLLVPPKIVQAIYNPEFVERLKEARRGSGDYNMELACEVLDDDDVNLAMYDLWFDSGASSRQTVVFCTNVQHAKDVRYFFDDVGIDAGVVYGDMDSEERKRTLADYASGKLQVLVNCAVLIEGWDDPHTSCVIILRPSSHVSTVMQMIGRGLRSLPDGDTGTKKDCIVIDMGVSCTKIKSLEQFLEFGLSKEEKAKLKAEAKKKTDAEKEKDKIAKRRQSLIDRMLGAIENTIDGYEPEEESCKTYWEIFSIEGCNYAVSGNFTVSSVVAWCDECKGKNAYGVLLDKSGGLTTCFQLMGTVQSTRVAIEAIMHTKGGSYRESWHKEVASDKQHGFIRSMPKTTIVKRIYETKEFYKKHQSGISRGTAARLITLYEIGLKHLDDLKWIPRTNHYLDAYRNSQEVPQYWVAINDDTLALI